MTFTEAIKMNNDPEYLHYVKILGHPHSAKRIPDIIPENLLPSFIY